MEVNSTAEMSVSLDLESSFNSCLGDPFALLGMKEQIKIRVFAVSRKE
jgi:hypothetical protein